MHASIAEREQFRSLSAAKLRKVESKTKEFILFLPRRSKFAIFDGKVTIATPHFVPLGQRISERNTKDKLVILHTTSRQFSKKGREAPEAKGAKKSFFSILFFEILFISIFLMSR